MSVEIVRHLAAHARIIGGLASDSALGAPTARATEWIGHPNLATHATQSEPRAHLAIRDRANAPKEERPVAVVVACGWARRAEPEQISRIDAVAVPSRTPPTRPLTPSAANQRIGFFAARRAREDAIEEVVDDGRVGARRQQRRRKVGRRIERLGRGAIRRAHPVHKRSHSAHGRVPNEGLVRRPAASWRLRQVVQARM